MTIEELINYRLHGHNGDYSRSITDIFSEICVGDTVVLLDVDYYVSKNNSGAEFPAFPKYPNYALKTLEYYILKNGGFSVCYTRNEITDCADLYSDMISNKKYILSCLYDNNLDLFMAMPIWNKIKDSIIALGGSNNNISGDYEFPLIISNKVAFIKFTDGCPNACSFCCCRNRPYNIRRGALNAIEIQTLEKARKVVILDENIGLRLVDYYEIIDMLLNMKNIEKVEVTNGFDYRFVLANAKNRKIYLKIKNKRLKALFAYDGRLNKLAEKCFTDIRNVCIYSLYGNEVYKDKFEMIRDLYYNITLKIRSNDVHVDPQLRYPVLNNERCSDFLKLFSCNNIQGRYEFAKRLAYRCTGDKLFEIGMIDKINNSFIDSCYLSGAYKSRERIKEGDLAFILSGGGDSLVFVCFLFSE